MQSTNITLFGSDRKKKFKKYLKGFLPVTLSLILVFSFVITAGAASYILGDADLDSYVSVLDATMIQRHLANIDAPADIGVNQIYSLNAKLLSDTTGVYEVKAVKGDKMDGDDPKTIGIPRVAKQNLENGPTLDAPAIKMGAANGFETKTGPVEWTMNEGLTEEDIVAPYSYFRHRVIDEVVTDADGNKTTHNKASGFDGTYYIVRVDVSELIDGKTVRTGNDQ